MMKRNDLFDSAEIARLKRKHKTSVTAAVLIGGLALLVCVLLCVFTRTGNAERMMLTAIAVSTVGGWIMLSLLMFPATDARHELRHAGMLREGPEESVRGMLTLEPGAMRIKGSIRFRSGRVRSAEGDRRIKVCASRAPLLPEGKELSFKVVNGYIAAWEEI